ncbi:YaaL family protein [Lactobacillus sp. ESL0679]|uniref:YaaL family protein n=1 Tax=unclassified Lactobacillus TaxID=2620435 RepID=UPI0023F83A42|nr:MULTISPECIES: YaaL family protein [unclassified Lactobacillus]MDF7681948.1 YaaL family protein [Lactobacillus sp. ESL0679]WEV50659.1 YaaL family protein [Lactobacillus sp. ESL0700]WEV61789.1 YaaL family protein [Lactobacillus sp. ESL0731]
MARTKVKQMGDDKLVDVIEKLQDEMAVQKSLDPTTLDMSDDNIIANKILQAKYSFLYNEARHRHTRFSGYTNAISE